MSWPAGPELNDLIRQETLYEKYLADILPVRDWTEADETTAGALAWRCLYGMVLEQAALGARMLLVPIESFSQDPVAVMRRIYEAVDLPEPERLPAVAAQYNSTSHIVTPDGSTKHVLQRDSRALSTAWKERLQPEEVTSIRRVTEEVFGRIYSDWESGSSEPLLLPA